MSKEIVMIVGKDGKVTLEANGFSGKACEKALEVFKKNMGTVTDVEEKPEYYDQEVEEENALWQG